MKPKVTKENRKLSQEYVDLLIQSSAQRVLEVLYKYPELEFSLSDLAKEAGVAKPHIGKILDNLERLGFITITKLSKIWRIKANRQSWNFIKSKVVYNLNFVYQSGIVEYLNNTFGNPRAIVLFGSFRMGEDISTSDIDIAIETSEPTQYKTIRLRELVDFERQINRRIQIHEFSRDQVDLHVFNNIANGILLKGFLEVHP